MRREDIPLRTTTGEPIPASAPVFGWFPTVNARVSLWYDGKHVKDSSAYTGAEYAIQAALELCEHYGITPDSPMVIAVCVTESEEPRVQRDHGNALREWVYPDRSRYKVPRVIVTRQYLAWSSARGAIDFATEYQPMRLRFTQRFNVQGPAAGLADLTPFFRGTAESIEDADIVSGIAHTGLSIEGLSITGLTATKKSGVFEAQAIGELTMLARDPRAMKEFGGPSLCCYPTGDQVYWFNGAPDSIQWEILR